MSQGGRESVLSEMDSSEDMGRVMNNISSKNAGRVDGKNPAY